MHPAIEFLSDSRLSQRKGLEGAAHHERRYRALDDIGNDAVRKNVNQSDDGVAADRIDRRFEAQRGEKRQTEIKNCKYAEITVRKYKQIVGRVDALEAKILLADSNISHSCSEDP